MELYNMYKYQKYNRELISEYSRGIKKQLRKIAYSLCYGKISEKYINTALNNFDYGYIYRDSTDYDNIIGFVIWKVYNKNTDNAELYIKLICGPNIGKLMFDDIENYAVVHKINSITLNPSNDIVKQIYTNKYGFKYRGYNNKQQLNIYYKPINYNSISRLSKRNRTLKRKLESKRATLKTKRQSPNSINNFISQSKKPLIENL